MRYFIDTSALVGIFDASDKYHPYAIHGLSEMIDGVVNLLISDYVFNETVTLLMNRGGKQQAVRFGRWVLNTENVELTFIDNKVWQGAWDMFQHYDDKQWAFADCTSFVLMRQQNIHQAFAFDRHFEQAGFQLWPGMG